MGKVNYRTCDVCGEELDTDPRFLGFVNGYRIWNRMFHGIDICNNCLSKIKQLSTDIDVEKKCWDLILEKNRKYSDYNEQTAYRHGVEDCLAYLSHRRLKEIDK